MGAKILTEVHQECLKFGEVVILCPIAVNSTYYYTERPHNVRVKGAKNNVMY